MMKIPTILVEKIARKVDVYQRLYHLIQHVWLCDIHNDRLNLNFFCFIVREWLIGVIILIWKRSDFIWEMKMS